MLRIRDTSGKALTCDASYRFLEVCDLDGKVAKVLYVDDHNIVNEVVAGSKEAERYQKLFKVEFVPITKLNEA